MEYYLLGMDFGNAVISNNLNGDIKKTIEHLFGIAATIPNSSINILVNQEQGEELAAGRFLTNCSMENFFLQVLPKIGMLTHASISSFAITALLLESISSANTGIKIFLGFNSFVSNLSIFYYTDAEFFDDINILIRRYIVDTPSEQTLKKLILDRLEKINYHLKHMNETNWLTLGNTKAGIVNSLMQLPDIEIDNKKSKKIRFVLGSMGSLIGLGAVLLYYNVGAEAIDDPCDALECADDTRELLKVIFAISTFTSFIEFAITQTKDGVEYIFDRVKKDSVENLLDSHALSKKVMSILLLLSLFSSIPNAYLAMKYFLETDMDPFLSIILVICAGLGPAIVNGKWFTELTEKFFRQLPATKESLLQMKVAIGNYCSNEYAPLVDNPVNAEGENQAPLFNKEETIEAIEKIRGQVPHLPFAKIKDIAALTTDSEQVKSLSVTHTQETIQKRQRGWRPGFWNNQSISRPASQLLLTSAIPNRP